METILCFVARYVSAVVMYFCICQLVPSVVSSGKMCLWLLLSLLPALPGTLMGRAAPDVQMLSLLISVVIALYFTRLFFRECRGLVLLYSTAFFGMQLGGEWVFRMFLSGQCTDHGNLPLEHLLMCAVKGGSVYVSLCVAFVLLVRTLSRRRPEPLYLLCCVFLVSWIIMILCSVRGSKAWVWILGVVLGLSGEIILLRQIVIRKRKVELAEELQNMRHVLEGERIHCSAVEVRQKELEHIRHDFNNHLATIRQLLQQGERGVAEQMVRELSDRVDNAGERYDCGIPVVNAVLMEKDWESRKAGVKLRVDLRMKADITVEPIHLCSIFSNLLDNAIRSAKASGEDEPEVVLTAAVEGDYLFVKTVNPALPWEESKKHRRYGNSILKNLAEQYGGSYQGEFRDHTYTAVISLVMQRSGKYEAARLK